MTKRQEVIKFASLNGLYAKADKQGLVILHKSAPNQLNDWTDIFDNWAQAHEFLLAQVHDVHDGKITQYPWIRA